MQTTKSEPPAEAAPVPKQREEIIDGQFNYSCNRCDHTWSAHGRIKTCPKCKASDVRKSPRPMDGQGELPLKGHAPKSATSGLTWCCQACEHTWRAGPGQKRCPECGVSEIEASIEGDAGDEPAQAKPKANGKAKKWGCDFAPGGEPRWCCPNCLMMVIQSVCPAVCKGCGEHGNPAQAFKPDFDHSQLPAETVPVKGETKAAAGETIVEIRHGDVEPHPENPRKHFAQQGLDELAEGFKKVGIINALTVRRLPASHRYQIIAGERRWRAAKIAKLTTVPCRVVDITDEEAYEVMIRENLDREDLDEIEKARSYQLGLEKCGLTQAQFAARYKKSQEHVSNTIRLLALPEAWQQRLIQRQITATHARELLAWIEVPSVLEKLDKRFDPKDVSSAADFKREVLDAVRDASRDMTYTSYAWGNGCRFKPTPAQAKELNIREVPRSWGGKERRAFNTKLWNELQGAAKKRRKQKEASSNASEAARRQRHQVDEARREFRLALWRHKYNWTASAIAAELTARPDPNIAQRTVALALLGGRHIFDEALSASLGFKREPGQDEAVSRVILLSESQINKVLLTEVVPQVLGAPLVERWDRPFNLPWMMHLAAQLHVDLPKQWTPSPEFIALYGEKELEALAEEWPTDAALPLNSPEDILAHWPKGFVPRELLFVDEKGDVKRPKEKAKKKKAKAKR